MESTPRDPVTSSMTSSAGGGEGDDEQEADEWCRLYEFVVCTLLIGSFCLFGLVGNGASFVVFCRQHKTGAAASAVLLLQCMAVCDSLLLLVAVAVYALPAVYPYSGHLLAVHQSFMVYVVYVWPPAMILHTVTVWLTVLVSVNRYQAVCRAMEEFGTTTLLRRTRIHVVVVVVAAVVFNVPRFFEHQASTYELRLALTGASPSPCMIMFNCSLIISESRDIYIAKLFTKTVQLLAVWRSGNNVR